MSTFICEKCGCIDNTSFEGTYWSISLYLATKREEDKLFEDEFYNNNPVCQVCAPSRFIDGSTNENAGTWHNKFKRKHWTEVFSSEEELKRVSNEKHGDYVNARKYLHKLHKGELESSRTKSW